MLDFPVWKRISLWLLTLACVLAAMPSIFAVSGLQWPARLIDPKVNLGLDLAGAAIILLEASADQIRRLSGSIRWPKMCATACGRRLD